MDEYLRIDKTVNKLQVYRYMKRRAFIMDVSTGKASHRY